MSKNVEQRAGPNQSIRIGASQLTDDNVVVAAVGINLAYKIVAKLTNL
jgi:hypothetical protein